MDSVVDYIIRPLYPEEIHLLRDFLYEAIFIPEGVEPLPRDVVDLPELKLYIQDFGKKQDDCCLVVEYDGKVVGAVWTRIMIMWMMKLLHFLFLYIKNIGIKGWADS